MEFLKKNSVSVSEHQLAFELTIRIPKFLRNNLNKCKQVKDLSLDFITKIKNL